MDVTAETFERDDVDRFFDEHVLAGPTEQAS